MDLSAAAFRELEDPDVGDAYGATSPPARSARDFLWSGPFELL